MTYLNLFTKPSLAAIFWGIIGGLSLILFIHITTNGPMHLVPYPFILIAAILTTRFNASNKKFSSLFLTGVLTFIIMSVILCFYVLTVINPNSGMPILGYVWRLGAIVGFGIVSSSILSYIIKKI